ncbi:hypothetical protein PYCCODRAFT_200671 [Trametes coccinea BRFM310]|uniref:Uncharacterized protein n=1 Tax=Trametes coccinea (strain BRFM310) TaxID=1353009 RepID=A0A1Y2IUC6_TRAC3|nr:hypothetical protein PYCCODRAFT_200671 [Trametes coccinea BRFM310]
MPAHEDHHRDVLSLRLALGSILSPKRPHPAHSAAASGTASPALHCPHTGIPLPPPSVSASSSHGSIAGTHSTTTAPSATTSPSPLSHAHTIQDTHPEAPDAVAAPTPRSATGLPASGGASGSATPGGRTNFVGALQSKSAWDALIHGSWV